MRLLITIICIPFLACAKDSVWVNSEFIRIGVTSSLGFCFPYIPKGVGIDYGGHITLKDRGATFTMRGVNILLFTAKKNRVEVQLNELTYTYHTYFISGPIPTYNSILLEEQPLITLYSIPVLYNRQIVVNNKVDFSAFAGISINRLKNTSTIYRGYSNITSKGFEWWGPTSISEKESNAAYLGFRYDNMIYKGLRFSSSIFYNQFLRVSGRYRKFKMPGISIGFNYSL
jgi:hypothetical protein